MTIADVLRSRGERTWTREEIAEQAREAAIAVLSSLGLPVSAEVHHDITATAGSPQLGRLAVTLELDLTRFVGQHIPLPESYRLFGRIIRPVHVEPPTTIVDPPGPGA